MTRTIWLVWHRDYEQSFIDAAYDSEALAEAHAKRRGDAYDVEGHTLRSEAPVWRSYFHGLAQVGCVNPALDREPWVEVAGETDEWQPDPNGLVSTCPGDWLLRDYRSPGDAVWLSVFDMDRDRVLERVTAKYRELQGRRAVNGFVPQWYELIQEDFAEA